MTRTVVMARSMRKVFPVMKALPTHTSLNSFIIQPESYGATVDEDFIVGGPVGDLNFALPRNGPALSGRCVI
jgi:hypothetical protein